MASKPSRYINFLSWKIGLERVCLTPAQAAIVGVRKSALRCGQVSNRYLDVRLKRLAMISEINIATLWRAVQMNCP